MYRLDRTNRLDCPIPNLLWLSDSDRSSVVRKLALEGAGGVSHAKVRIPVPGCGGGIAMLCILQDCLGQGVRACRNVLVFMYRQGRVMANQLIWFVLMSAASLFRNHGSERVE